MKKVNLLKLKDATILSDDEMKQVFGGSGITGGNSGVREWNCLCHDTESGALGDNGQPLPPDKKVTIKAKTIMEAVNKAASACIGYQKVNCI